MKPAVTTAPAAVTYVGVDIAKRTLEVSPNPAWPSGEFANDPAGHRRLVKRLKKLSPPAHVICEATGGYERDLLASLHKAGILVSLINPRNARDFASARPPPRRQSPRRSACKPWLGNGRTSWD